MKVTSIRGHALLRRAQWLAACLALSACGGGNNGPTGPALGMSVSNSHMEGMLRIEGQAYDPVPCAVEGGTCSLIGEQNVAYGIDNAFVTRRFTARAPCNDEAFGMRASGRTRLCFVALASAAPAVVTVGASGPSTGTGTTIPVVSNPAPPSTGVTTTSAPPGDATTGAATPSSPGSVTSSPPTSPPAGSGGGTGSSPPVVHGGIPVDTTALPVLQPGVSTVLLTQTGVIPPLPAASDWEHDGALRLVCNVSRMAFDDPIVYPGQPGVAHHHTFFGNTAVDATTTVDNLRTRGNATCRGGTINMSAYWVPSMIDTTTSRPIAPKSLLIYYKTGSWTYMADGSVLQPLPKGLRMIAGDASRSAPGGVGTFSCMIPSVGNDRNGTLGSTIPTTCQSGDEIWMRVKFPQCWDGQNLDSPDHKSHMAYPEGWPQYSSPDPARAYRCPLTHPVVLPAITFIVMFTLPANGDTSHWRLASDTYSGPAGYSAHGDWMDGWDPAVSDLWGVECLRKRRDCGSANLGDGRTTNEFQGN